MTIGNLDEALSLRGTYAPIITKVLEFVKRADCSAMPDGKYPIPGTPLAAQIHRYHSKPHAQTRPEAHRRHVDFLYIVEGNELLGWCPSSPALEQDGDYESGRDFIFYKSLAPDTSLPLRAGNFVLLMPTDVHAPYRAVNDQPSPVTKVIVKIPTTMLEQPLKE